MAEVICREDRLISALIAVERRAADAGVVHEEVERLCAAVERFRERVDRLRIHQIHVLDRDVVEPGEDLTSARHIAHRDGDACSRRVQCPCRLEPDADRAAGDDRGRAREVDSGDDIGGRARGAEARADGRLHPGSLPRLHSRHR